MADPENTHLGRGRYADRSFDTDEPVSANPSAMRTYADDAPEPTASVRSLAGTTGTALAGFRQNAVFAEAQFRHREGIEWHDGWTDANGTARSATDAVVDLCDDFDHLDAFVGSVADAFFAAERLDADDPGADQAFTLTAGDIEAHGVGFANREDSIAHAEALAEEFENFDGTTTVEELEAWGDAVAVIQNDTAGSVTFIDGIGDDGLEQLPGLEPADGDLPQSVIDTAGTSLETALDTLPRDEPWEHTDPANTDLPMDHRLDPGTHVHLLDNPDALAPYTNPTTPNINHTLGHADARHIDSTINHLDDGLVTVTEGSGFDMQVDEEGLAELAELYPELASSFGERPSFLHDNEHYAGAMTEELGADNVRTLADLTNTFGLAFDEGLIVSIEGHDSPIHRSGEHDIALTGTHGDDGPFVYFVEPLATTLGTADRTGHMDDATRDALTAVTPEDVDMGEQELLAVSVQRERSAALLQNAGDFSPETAALLADNTMAAHRDRPSVQTGGATYDQFDDLEGFTSEAFLTSSPDREPLASNEWAVYDALERNPEAGSRYYTDPDNVEPVMTWGGDVDVYADGVMLASERLGEDMRETSDRMQQTSANSVDKALTSSDDEHRPQAMETTVHVVTDLERQGEPVNDTISNPYIRPVLANGTAANMDVIDSMINEGDERGAEQETVQGFLTDVMSDESSLAPLRNGVDTYILNERIPAAESDADARGVGAISATFDEAEIALMQTRGRDEIRDRRSWGYWADWTVGWIPHASQHNAVRQLIGDASLGNIVDQLLGDDYDALAAADQRSRIILEESRLRTANYVAAANWDSSPELRESASGMSFVGDDGSLMGLQEMNEEQFGDFAAWTLSEEIYGNPLDDDHEGLLFRQEISNVTMDTVGSGRTEVSSDLRFPSFGGSE